MTIWQRMHGAAGLVRRTVRRPIQARAFDRDYYLEHNPDVAQSVGRRGALEHYRRHGWREGRRPNSWFDPRQYIAEHHEVLESDSEPLEHFLRGGGRPDGTAAGGGAQLRHQTIDEALLAHQVDVVGEQFDGSFYSSAYRDELPPGTTDPLRHYLTVGWREGRNPTPTFDTGKYLDDNPDVAAAGINPFVHFWEYGLEQGRRLRRTQHPEIDRLDLAVAPRELAQLWRRGAQPDQSLEPLELASALAGIRHPAQMVLSFSHDDYAESVGGIQQLLAREEHDLAGEGVHYLHLSPSVPLLMLADEDDPQARMLHARLDGVALGTVAAGDLGDALAHLVGAGVPIDGVVHQLLGYAPEVVTELLVSAGVEQPLVWVHDYSGLCSSYGLLRNMVEFCGAPPIRSTACMICCHGVERASHTARIAAFHRAHRPVVFAPSRFAADMWERGDLARSSLAVQPLAELVDDIDDPRPRSAGPLRVAHLGARSYLKGWHVFAALAERHGDDGRFEFFQLGVSGDMLPSRSVRSVQVRPASARENAMIHALQEHEIDVVVNWSLAAETFSFTTYEAMAAGAFVVTHPGSGNVWSAVVEHGAAHGVACPDPTALQALFAGDALDEAVSAGPRRRRRLVPCNPSAAHLRRRLGNASERGGEQLGG